jgi:hypothetical protein
MSFTTAIFLANKSSIKDEQCSNSDTVSTHTEYFCEYFKFRQTE